MNILVRFIICFVALGLVGCSHSTPSPVPIIESIDAPTTTPQIPSLPALFEKQFDGRNLTLGRVLAKTDAYTRYYITYESGELTISGIMNVPHGNGPFPLLILNHGYIDPAVYTNGRGLKREQDYFARNGYVVIHPDYRNHAESDDDAENELHFRIGYTEDVINAVLAAKSSSLPFIDASRVGMLGHSMGGGVTQNILVTQPNLVKAAVLFAPVSGDFRDNYERWSSRRPEVVEAIVGRYGDPIANPVFWDNLSPKMFLNRVAVPVMIHHGTADDSVPLSWSQRLQEMLKNETKDVTLYVYDGEPHEFIQAWPTVMRRSIDFFDTHVKKSE